MEAFFSPILRCSPKTKKKVLRLSSATFLRDFCDIPERGTVNRGCLRFLAGHKNAGFWREKKRRNSQNFSAKMPEKISHFFALIGNTARLMFFYKIAAFTPLLLIFWTFYTLDNTKHSIFDHNSFYF